MKLPPQLTLGKWAVIVVIALAWTLLVYQWSTHKCEMAHASVELKQAEEKTKTIIKEVQVRVPVVQTREVASTKQRAEIKRLGDLLDEEINKRSDASVCNLGADELRLFQELAAATAIK